MHIPLFSPCLRRTSISLVFSPAEMRFDDKSFFFSFLAWIKNECFREEQDQRMLCFFIHHKVRIIPLCQNCGRQIHMQKGVSKTVKICINQTFCVTATKASFWKVEDKKKKSVQIKQPVILPPPNFIADFCTK